jgi:hypothetical protein
VDFFLFFLSTFFIGSVKRLSVRGTQKRGGGGGCGVVRLNLCPFFDFFVLLFGRFSTRDKGKKIDMCHWLFFLKCLFLPEAAGFGGLRRRV